MCFLLRLNLPEQAMGWLPLRFGIDKPTEFSCRFYATTLETSVGRRHVYKIF